jgi:outer membrane protein assembly factor BamE (lipoprotein component of BamABCDE complex)
MIHRIIQLLLVGAFLVSCATSLSSIEKASANYKQDRDYTSLEIIYKNLSKGMQRKEVERLLGEPDYSPIDGQYYYSSNRSAYAEDQGREVAIGVVVDYRDRNGDITEKLQEFWLGPIGE